jgi:hypothetical protein
MTGHAEGTARATAIAAGINIAGNLVLIPPRRADRGRCHDEREPGNLERDPCRRSAQAGRRDHGPAVIENGAPARKWI